jgi:PAS domain S-box-containing protein
MTDEAKTREQLITELRELRQRVAELGGNGESDQAGGSLQMSGDQARRLLEWLPDPVVLYNLQGQVVYFNQAFEHTFGWSLDELIGKRIDFVPEENLPETQRAIEQGLSTKKPQIFETRRRTKDGRILDIQINGSALFNPDGSPTGLVVALRDITERKQAEAELWTYRGHLEELVAARTAELTSANAWLQREIAERGQAEQALRRAAQRLEGLHAIDRAILVAQSLKEIARVALAGLNDLVPCEWASVMLFDFAEGQAQALAERGVADAAPPRTSVVPIADFPLAEMTLPDPLYAVADIAALADRATLLERLLAAGLHSFIGAPLFVQGEVDLIGGLLLAARAPAAFGLEHRDIVRDVASQLAVAIQQEQFRQDLRRHAVQLAQRVVERERAEAALAAERNLLRTLIDNLPDYIYVKDTAGRFLIANIAVAQLMGAATPEALVGQIDFDFYPAELAEQFHADEQALIQSGQPLIDREEPVIDQITGQKRWLSTTKVPLRDPQGQLVGLVGLGRDISERKRLEAQLLQAQKMEAIGRLAGGVAHDFNNVLTAILGYAELVLDELDAATPLHQEIEAIQNAGKRAAALTRQLLAFSRQQVLQPTLLNLNALVANLSQMLRRLISEDIELITIPGPDLGNLKVDPSQLEQVVVNLVVNARDAMPEGGTLTIETANVELDADYAHQHVGVKAGPYIMLAISDTGQGMDAPTQARIFEPFFTTKEAGKGTGLGLATVHGIVNQSGGHIWVYSEVGHGTTFKIYLPQAAEREIRAQVQPSSARAPQGSETILLVEDDALVRQLVQEVLRKYGYIVLEVSTGKEALKMAQTYRAPIDLLITDVILPGGIRGTQVARQLLAQRLHLKVLYMSGYTDNAIVQHGVLGAGVAFLQKPFTPETLARKVREVLDTPASGGITIVR